MSYEYDGSSRLISVKDSEGNQAVSYAYDTEGSLSERQAANGLKTTYGYDYQNRLTSMTNETGKGVVSKYSSTYLKNGQKAEEVSTVMDKKGKSTKKQQPTPMTCLAVLPEKQKQEGKIFPIPMTPTITGNR